MIRSDGTVELTYNQLLTFFVKTMRVMHSRETPATKVNATSTMIEGYLQAPATDEVKRVTFELSAPRLAQLCGLSMETAVNGRPLLKAMGMDFSEVKEQAAAGRVIKRIFVDMPFDLNTAPLRQTKPKDGDRSDRDQAKVNALKAQKEAVKKLADLATEMLNTPCPVCGTVGNWHFHCESCGATWSTQAAANSAPPDIEHPKVVDVIGPYSQAPAKSDSVQVGAQTPAPASTDSYTVQDGNFCDSDSVRVGSGPSGTISKAVDVPPTPLPPAAPYEPGPDEHPDPLINAIGLQKRFLPCAVIPQKGKKPKKQPMRYGQNGAPLFDDWQDPEYWLTYYAAQVAGQLPAWDANAFSVQMGGPVHDLVNIDFDECVRGCVITSVNVARIVAYLGTYTTASASKMFLPVYGLHSWLIDKTHLIPSKHNERMDPAGIGIYRHCGRHVCETFEPFGELLPIRVITDPAQARAVCRVLGVQPMDEQTIAASVPSHPPAPGTRDRFEWAQRLLDRLSAYRCDDYYWWIRVGMSLYEFGNAGLSTWDKWSKPSDKYEPGACEDKWKSFDTKSNTSKRITLGSLYHWANEDDPGGGK